jgi:hypothetical protein
VCGLAAAAVHGAVVARRRRHTKQLHLVGPHLLHDSRRGSGNNVGRGSPELPPSIGARERGGVHGPALGAMSVLRGKEEDDDGVCTWTATGDGVSVGT